MGDRADPAPPRWSLRSRLAVARVVTDAAGGAIVRMALLAPHLAHEGAVTEPDRLSSPFFVEVDRRGLIRFIWLPPDVPRDTSWIFRRIAAEFQFVESGEEVESWTTVEGEVGGPCESTYRKVGRDSYEKTKRRIGRCRPGGGRPPAAWKILEFVDRAEYRFDSEGQVMTVASRSAQRVARPGQTPLTASEVFTATRVDVVSGASAARLPERRYRCSPLPVGTAPTGPATSPHRDLQSSASYRRLVASLDRESDGDERALNRLGLALVSLFRRRPSTAAQVRGSLPAMKDRRAGELVAALAASRTPDAERVLCSVASDPSATEIVRVAAVRGLANGSPPSAEAVELLTKLARDGESPIHRVAVLMLGTAAYRGAGTSYRDTLVEELISRFARAVDRDERQLALAALGNTGSARILATVEAAMGDDDPGVRAFAVSALRLVPGGDAEGLIARVASEDDEAGVRRAALFAVGYRRPPAQLETVSRVLIEDDDATARGAALWLLEDLYHAGSPVEELMRWTADNDRDLQIRTRARRALASEVLAQGSGSSS